jgi:hypothetical protein
MFCRVLIREIESPHAQRAGEDAVRLLPKINGKMRIFPASGGLYRPHTEVVL